MPFLSERQTPHSSPFVCPAPPPPPLTRRRLPRCPTRIPARSRAWAEPLDTSPPADGDTEAGAERREQGLREPPTTCRAPRHRLSPAGRTRAPGWVAPRFCSCAFAFQGPGRGHGGQSGPRPQAAAGVGLSAPSGRTKAFARKQELRFAGRTGWGVRRALQRPTAVRPSWDREGGGEAERGGGTGSPSGPRTPPAPGLAETAVWCALVPTPRIIYGDAGSGSDAGPSHRVAGGGQWRLRVSGPSPLLRSPGPQSPHQSDGGAWISPGRSPLENSLPEGCAPGTQKGLSECGLGRPFPALFLSCRPSRSHWRQDELSGKSKGSRCRETWIQILLRPLPAV